MVLAGMVLVLRDIVGLCLPLWGVLCGDRLPGVLITTPLRFRRYRRLIHPPPVPSLPSLGTFSLVDEGDEEWWGTPLRFRR